MTSAVLLQCFTKSAIKSTGSCSFFSAPVEDNNTCTEANMHTSSTLEWYTYLLLTKCDASTGRILACPEILTVQTEHSKVKED